MRTVSKAGLEVSAMCLGCMHMGTRLDRNTSFAMLDQYVEAGGRFVDTSNNYAFWMDGAEGGESEAVLGEWLTDRGMREEIMVATKVGAQPTVRGGGFEAAEGLSRQAIMSAVEGSLKRLRVEKIDLYYAHVEDPATPRDETLSAFEDLKSSGKIEAIGCSNHSAEAATPDIYQALQQRLTYLNVAARADIWPQKTFDPSVQQATKSKLIVAYAALGAGAYAGAPLPDIYDTSANVTRLETVNKHAKRLGITGNQVVLSGLMAHGVVPLVASSQKARLLENLAALDISLDAVAMCDLGPLT